MPRFITGLRAAKAGTGRGWLRCEPCIMGKIPETAARRADAGARRYQAAAAARFACGL